MRRARRSGAAALALVAALALGACSGPGASSASSGSAAGAGSAAGSGSAAVPAPAAGAGAGAGPGGGSGGGSGGTAQLAAAADRQVVTTASATLTTARVAAAADRISALVDAAGGRTQERSQDAAGSGRRASARLVVRVPAPALTSTLARLHHLGDVSHELVRSSDVTAASVDLAARVSALQSSTARLQHLLDTAATTADLVAAESALTDRQGRLESLQAQQRVLSGQVELSTLTVTVRPTGAPVAPGGFTSGLRGGWHALAASAAVFLVVLGAALPWLALVAAAGAVALVVRRAVRALRRPAPLPR